jgi:hypothetical protein
MPPKPFGTVGEVPVAEAEAVDNPARVGIPAGVLADAPIAGSFMVVAAVPGDTLVATGGAMLAYEALVATGAALPCDVAGATGGALLGDVAPARTPPVEPAGYLGVGKPPPGATPTGLEIFLAPALALGAAASETDVPRGTAPVAPEGLEELVAPIETPTGREAPTGAVPDGEDAIAGLRPLGGGPPLLAELPVAAGAPAEAGVIFAGACAGALATGRGAVDRVMSAAEAGPEELAPPATPNPVAGALPRAAMAPVVPSVRGGAFGSEAPKSTSGSSSSADANSVGIRPESALASETDVAEAGEVVEMDGAAGASGSRASSTPWASRSSSESITPFDGEVGGDIVADAGAGLGDAGCAPPACDAVPFNPKGSSTGRSAKGSKAGREAASIVFEPDSGDQS